MSLESDWLDDGVFQPVVVGSQPVLIIPSLPVRSAFSSRDHNPMNPKQATPFPWIDTSTPKFDSTLSRLFRNDSAVT